MKLSGSNIHKTDNLTRILTSDKHEKYNFQFTSLHNFFSCDIIHASAYLIKTFSNNGTRVKITQYAKYRLYAHEPVLKRCGIINTLTIGSRE